MTGRLSILDEIDEALALQEIKRAEIALVRALKTTQTPAERAALLFRRAQARLMDARPDDALEDLTTSLALEASLKDHPDTALLLGDIYFSRFELANVGFANRADTETAHKHYQALISEHPQHPRRAWAYYQLGRIKLSQNEAPEAARYFRQALALPPLPAHVHALAYERLGFIALMEDRQAQAALGHLQAAQQAAPPEMDATWQVQLQLRMSRAHLDLGAYGAALEAAQQALRLAQAGSSPQHRAALPEAHLALGEIMAKLSGYEEQAIEHYVRFLQASKRPPGIDVTWGQVYEQIGQLYLRLENFQLAMGAFEKVLELNPFHAGDSHLQYQIARCCYRLRLFERGLAVLEGLHQAAQAEGQIIHDWKIFHLKANLLFALEKYAPAAAAYQQSLALTPPPNKAKEIQIYLRFSQELAQNSG
jgi:tetratricopeptide (TPR) repeat protein